MSSFSPRLLQSIRDSAGGRKSQKRTGNSNAPKGMQMRINPLHHSSTEAFPGIKMHTDEEKPKVKKNVAKTKRRKRKKSGKKAKSLSAHITPATNTRLVGGTIFRHVERKHFEPSTNIENERENRFQLAQLKMRRTVFQNFVNEEKKFAETLKRIEKECQLVFQAQMKESMLQKESDPYLSNHFATEIFGKLAPLILVSQQLYAQFEKSSIALAENMEEELSSGFASLSEFIVLFREHWIQYMQGVYAISLFPAEHVLRQHLNFAFLKSSLHRPVERMAEYQAVIPQLYSLTPSDHKDSEALEKAHHQIEQLVGVAAWRAAKDANRQLLLELNLLLKPKKNYVVPELLSVRNREYVGKQSFPRVTLNHVKKEYAPCVLWLLSDLLLVTVPVQEQEGYKLLLTIDINRFLVVSAESGVTAGSETTNGAGGGGVNGGAGGGGEWLFTVASKTGSAPVSITVACSEQAERKEWMACLAGLTMQSNQGPVAVSRSMNAAAGPQRSPRLVAAGGSGAMKRVKSAESITQLQQEMRTHEENKQTLDVPSSSSSSSSSSRRRKNNSKVHHRGQQKKGAPPLSSAKSTGDLNVSLMENAAQKVDTTFESNEEEEEKSKPKEHLLDPGNEKDRKKRRKHRRRSVGPLQSPIEK